MYAFFFDSIAICGTKSFFVAKNDGDDGGTKCPREVC